MKQTSLLRSLGPWQSIAIVIGIVIGTGVFLKTAVMAQQVGSPERVLWAWAAAGVLSLLGALTYAELGALFPHSGGDYVFLREGYGPLPAFLFGWTRFWIITPGSIAAYAVGAATFLGLAEQGMRLPVALLLLSFFTVLNCFSVAFTGKIQTLLTAMKVLMILALTLGIFLFADAGQAPAHFSAVDPKDFSWPAFGAAMLAALWAFDGWNNLPLAAGEVHEPKRNLPLALALGTLGVLAIYAAVNVAYFWALPFSEIITSSSTQFRDAPPVAAKAAGAVLGAEAVTVLSFMFVLSALGAMNGSILTGARVPLAMAQDGLFFKRLGYVSMTARVPVVSVVVQGVIAAGLAMAGTFDQLTDYVIFASWIFYALVASSIFIFRGAKRKLKSSYQVPGYPWLPALFVAASVLLLANTLWTAPRESLIGLGFIVTGVPVFYIFNRKSKAFTI